MDLAENYGMIQQRMAAACERAGRDPASVTLLAVTKGQPPEAVQAAARLGQMVFGENKVQEARAKIPLCPGRIRWQLIGHLQSNKCRDAVDLFTMIQSVDSLALAREIDRRAGLAGRSMPVLVEVNVAGEGSKFGYAPDRLLAEVAELAALPRIELQGLMTIPPWSSDPERARPHFRRLRELKERAEAALGAPLAHLSMGMSGDFEIGIAEGATIIRIGTALFGPRPPARPRPAEE